MRMSIIPLTLVATAALAGCQSTEEALAERGVPQMTGPEIVELIAGNTVRQEGDGWVWHGFYAKDGTVVGRTTFDGGIETGRGVWEVNERDLECTDWDNDWGGGGYGCSAYYRDGEVIHYVHREGSRGNYPEGSFTVLAGNPENL